VASPIQFPSLRSKSVMPFITSASDNGRPVHNEEFPQACSMNVTKAAPATVHCAPITIFQLTKGLPGIGTYAAEWAATASQ